jgi:hypothetical protein
MKVEPGDRVKLGLDTSAIHLFNSETEQALF